MAVQTYDQQVMWQPASGTATLSLDASQQGATLPRRVGDGRRSFSFHTQRPAGDSGTPKGKLSIQLSNAPVSGGKLVEPTDWVEQSTLTYDIGGADALPAMQAILINFAGWARLVWAPAAGSSGHLATFFDGVRA